MHVSPHLRVRAQKTVRPVKYEHAFKLVSPRQSHQAVKERMEVMCLGSSVRAQCTKMSLAFAWQAQHFGINAALLRGGR